MSTSTLPADTVLAAAVILGTSTTTQLGAFLHGCAPAEVPVAFIEIVRERVRQLAADRLVRRLEHATTTRVLRVAERSEYRLTPAGVRAGGAPPPGMKRMAPHERRVLYAVDEERWTDEAELACLFEGWARPVAEARRRLSAWERKGWVRRRPTGPRRLLEVVQPASGGWARHTARPYALARRDQVEHTLLTVEAALALHREQPAGTRLVSVEGDEALRSEAWRRVLAGKPLHALKGRPKRKKGEKAERMIDALPDGRITFARPDGTRQVLGVEYLASQYSNADVETKLRDLPAGTIYVVATPRMAARVARLTGMTARVLGASGAGTCPAGAG